MTLDPDTCYRAFASRDRRFEGRFVTAVVTTGIYCRPGCPARLPRRRNMKFFACAAAAEEAGFRPCLRCRPESAPGSPAWIGTSATVNRALRLIDEGALDDVHVDQLADRLGVTDRHLRRLFAEHLGASPHAVARTRRVHFARRLIDETRLPFGEIALSAGFANVRRFNHAVRDTFGRSPRELRSRLRAKSARAPRPRGRGNGDLPADGALRLSLRARAPFDGGAVLAFLAARVVPGLESVESRAYHRAIEWSGTADVLSVKPTESGIDVRISRPAMRDLIGLATRAARLFDLDADSRAILAHLRRDPWLARALAGRRDLRVPGAWQPFELAVRAILGQQVSVRGAATLTARLVSAYGAPLERPAHAVTHVFPTPERLATADLSAVGMPRARTAALTALARAVADGRLRFERLRSLEDAVRTLSELPGIGDWTAHYIAMRALREPDAFPAADLGLIRAMEQRGTRHAEHRTGAAPARALERHSEAWRPWRAYAVIALWTRPQPNRRSTT